MTRAMVPGIIAALLLSGPAFSDDEAQLLSLHAAQPLRAADVVSTGRAVPQYTTLAGSRLAGTIVEWGKNEAGQPLDVGMTVKKDQMLFSVDPRTYKARADMAQAALDGAQAAYDNLVAPMRKERLAVLRAGVSELAARVKDNEHDEERYRQLVEVDKTVPVKRLEEARLTLELAREQLKAAQARLDEAVAGPTPTEVAMAGAHVKEAQAARDAARLDLSDTAVRAPFDGAITRRGKGLGDYVAGAPFIEVLELTTVDQIEADLRLPESYLPNVKAGQTRLVLRSPLMECELDLPVTRVISDVDPQRGTFGIRVAVPPGQRCGLVPGAFVTATFKFEGRDGGVVVPQRAVFAEGGKNYVLVAESGKMRRRIVEVGDRLTEGVILRSGVHAGEQVIAGPVAGIKDGAPLPAYLSDKK